MAAARLLHSRLASFLGRNQPRSLFSQRLGLPFHVTKGLRAIHESDNRNDNSAGDSQSISDDSVPLTKTVKVHNVAEHESSKVTYKAFSNLKTSSNHDMAMIFTCKVCETRSVKTMCRQSYEKGVVVARCGGCNNLHLIADHLGWFGEPGTVEDLLSAKGEEVRRGSVDTLNLTLEDLVGTKS